MAEFVNTIDLFGDNYVIDSILDRSITEFRDNMLTRIGSHSFHGCAALEVAELPNVTEILQNAFNGCSSLKKITCKELLSLPSSVFNNCSALEGLDVSDVTKAAITCLQGCKSLKKLRFKSLEALDQQSLKNCESLEEVDFHVLTKFIGGYQLQNTKKLTTVIIRTQDICTLASANTFLASAVESGTGYIYVPRALIEDYKVATNWSTYADQFRAIEDWSLDGTTTGEIPTECDSISLNVSELNLTDDTPYTLIATTIPNKIVGKSVSWMSDNIFVATVRDGVITAMGDGVATITATCGEHSATCTVSVSGVGTGMPIALYSLPQETIFNGTSDYIDTGIKLFDNPKSFTIICDATF